MNNISGSKKFFGGNLAEKKIVGESQRQLHGEEVKEKSRGLQKGHQSVSFAPMEVESKGSGIPVVDGSGDLLDLDGSKEPGLKLTAQQRYRRLKAQAEGVEEEEPTPKGTGVWGIEGEGDSATAGLGVYRRSSKGIPNGQIYCA